MNGFIKKSFLIKLLHIYAIPTMNLQTGCNEYLPPGIDFVEIGKRVTKFSSTFRGDFYYQEKKIEYYYSSYFMSL